MKPSFSVVVPVYNRGNCIDSTLQSLFQQSYPAVLLVIVDDGSTDDTKQRLLAYEEQPNVRVLSQHHEGAAAARNLGAHECRSDYVTFLDSDDLVAPRWLERIAEKAEAACRPEVISCGFSAIPYAQPSTTLRRERLPDRLWYAPEMVACFDHAGCFACRLDFFKEVGGFREGLSAGQLHEFGIRAAATAKRVGGRMESVNEPLVTYVSERPDNIRGDLSAVAEGVREIVRVHSDVYKANPREHASALTLIGVRLVLLGRLREGRVALLSAALKRPLQLKAWGRVLLSLCMRCAWSAWSHVGRRPGT